MARRFLRAQDRGGRSATDDGPLGFICIVKADRDHPIRPTAEELEQIYAEHPELKGVIRV
ncbi:hypothetical protein [Bifidobacterium myosotis]|uniref:Uncharacterized protein n=1 Tax=Bifidobacterium myosotis TaxID=1630166 RepID=A0A5M9ZQG2_9BIFI|nr:hypothetical protein [Bifidobacterium myosotis]KAA8829770.1 hypothetical protein EMO91_02065 [Bifidobacterium myosotis]